MNKQFILAVFISLLVGFIIGTYFSRPKEIIIDNSNKIDSLYQINDSLNTRLDSVHKQLEVNGYIYEKACSIIINQSFAADKESFSKYLERFSSDFKSRTSKDN